MTTIKKILEYFKENEDVFNSCVEELDSYNGFLGDDHVYPMEELNELYAGTEPIDILYRAFYGHDAENYSIDADGEKHYSEFNPNRDYFYFNGYGNLVSCDYIDYSDKLDEYTIEQLRQNRQYIDTIDNEPELTELFDELEETEEE